MDISNTIEYIGDDIAEEMLNAISRNSEDEENIDDNIIPINDQKKFLMTNINLLSQTDRLHIGNILILNNRRSGICECSEGSVINLDTLPDIIINQMYELMLHKFNTNK